MIIDNYRGFQNYLFFGSWKKTVLKIKISGIGDGVDDCRSKF